MTATNPNRKMAETRINAEGDFNVDPFIARRSAEGGVASCRNLFQKNIIFLNFDSFLYELVALANIRLLEMISSRSG